MKTRRPKVTLQNLVVLLLTSSMLLSCEKDADDLIITPVPPQRISEILAMKGGTNNFKDICFYENNRISTQYRYHWSNEGEWRVWIRYLFEYEGEDLIVEVMEGVSDSSWFPAIKWEKKFQDGMISEMTEAHWSSMETGCWEPIRKLSYVYEGKRLIRRLNYKFENDGWEESWIMDYHYTGSLWSGATIIEQDDDAWDTIKCMSFGYNDGNLREVKIYKHDCNSGWNLDEQCLFEYESMRMTRMIVNEVHGDSISLDMVLHIDYNENSLPVSYTEEFECCPTQSTLILYEMEEGNELLPSHNDFTWDEYPWIPAPVKR